ncbi:hypothetical protein [Peptostreptococcus equinus]|uniref:Uncharacterized protein n=1 Tax=Peptostreptococcus equinus TaxID=3003601 RepID=A0ABY7JMJ0_9FIRM|nr:hypothetical protein [Peptostreptococcus sp. CBA3647]WAW14576.1 hypothetical protein O0R46_08225 [Peptostreptococcus sp. CBA3647]
MGKHIIEKDYHRLDPVGQSDMCADCSAGCKISCSRKMAHNMGNDVSYIIDDSVEKEVKIDRLYDVIVKDVDSIPCDLKTQKLVYDVNGKLIEGELKTPWPMNWIYEVVSNFLAEDDHLSGTKSVRFVNPEEKDQLLICDVVSYVQRR